MHNSYNSNESLNLLTDIYSSSTRSNSNGGLSDSDIYKESALPKKTPAGTPALGAAAERIQFLYRHFYYFSAVCSINHALPYVACSYSSSILQPSDASFILGLSWFLNAVSGLTIANTCVVRFGYKVSMIISLFGFALQACALYFAALDNTDRLANLCLIVGSVISGITSAIWWTAQGVCFNITCHKIAAALQEGDVGVNYGSLAGEERTGEAYEASVGRIRARLSSSWTLIYQLSDIAVFLSLSLFPIFIPSLSITTMLLWLAGIGLLTALLGFTLSDLGDNGTVLDFDGLKKNASAVIVQFSGDSRSVMLAPFIFGFGIATATYSDYFNYTYVSNSSNLGPLYIGLLEALSYLVAALSAIPYGYLSSSVAMGQHHVMQFGNACYLLCGLLLLALTRQQTSSLVGVVAARVVYGLARGVFEGVCRAVYAEIFEGADLSAAYSAQTLLAGVSGGLTFFVIGDGGVSPWLLGLLLVVNGIIAVFSYHILIYALPSFKKRMGYAEALLHVAAYIGCGSKSPAR